MSKCLLIRVATENEVISTWPEVAIVKLSEKFVEDLKAIRDVVLQHDLLSAEYGKSHILKLMKCTRRNTNALRMDTP